MNEPQQARCAAVTTAPSYLSDIVSRREFRGMSPLGWRTRKGHGQPRPPSPRLKRVYKHTQITTIYRIPVLKINIYTIISAVFGLTLYQIPTSSFHTRSSAPFPSVDKTKPDGLVITKCVSRKIPHTQVHTRLTLLHDNHLRMPLQACP